MLNSEAKTIIVKAYVENHGSPDLSQLPIWISPSEAEQYIEELRADPRPFSEREVTQVMQQDIRSRRELL